MLHRLILAAALAVGLSSAAQAQVPQVVPACGASSGLALAQGPGGRLAVTPDGTLCTTAGSGGSGGSSTVTQSPGSQEGDVSATRTLDATSTASQQTYAVNGQGTLSFTVSGLTASGATISFFQSNDWNGTTGTFTPTNEVNTGTGAITPTRTTDGQSAIGVEGAKAIRFQVTTAGTGTITLATNISVRDRYVALRSPPLVGQFNTTLPTLASGQFATLALDSNGREILSPSSAITAAPPASSAYAIQKTASIGTTGVSVSAADATNRRTIVNTSALACEIVQSGASFGSGFPLPAGQTFTFDAAGRMAGALFVACNGTTGTVAVLSY